jgi:hypothetical protein
VPNQPTVSHSSCGCKQAAAGQNEGVIDMNKEAKIKALIDSGKFTEADRTWLNTVPDERLDALTPAAPVAAASAPVAGASAETAEQFISAAPAHIQAELRDALRVSEVRRSAVITALKATGSRCSWTDAELAAKSTQELEKLAVLASAPAAAPTPVLDFSGRGTPRVSSRAAGDDEIEEAPSLIAALQTKAK